MTEIRFGKSLPARPLKLRMKGLREAQGLTVPQLAQRAGCSPVTIQRLERGEGRPNRADLERFAAALGVSPEELVDPAPT
jgi:transcriptional regulator with XRE-family HTH domain